jgi:PTH1 family peptidyl-tRNA hydrolase
MTILILGLGNPGREYESTRHNFGFLLAEALRLQFDFPEWRLEKKFQAEISEGSMGNQKIILARPQTFMNLSGVSAASLSKFYKILPAQVLVLVDDVALPFGAIRFRDCGSSGGHNGLKSLTEHLGTENFPRLRLGIESRTADSQIATTDFVLGKFSSAEKKILPEILQKARGLVIGLVGG